MSVESGLFVPAQPSGREPDMETVRSSVETAVQDLQAGRLVVWDNGTVYALVGNGNDPDIQRNIRHVKGDARGAAQPVGWTVQFHRGFDLIDMDKIESPELRALVEKPNELTRRIGAIAFLRAPASLRQKAARNIPDAIIEDRPDATVQIYSPTGSDATSRLVRTALTLGVEPVMTSANVSGRPEIVHEQAAVQFAGHPDRALTAVVNAPDTAKPVRPRGSYPVIGLGKEALTIIRPGCFDIEITKRLLENYPVRLADPFQIPNYPDNVLRFEDLERLAADYTDFRELPNLQGAELRAGILAVVGWHYDSWATRDVSIQHNDN